MLTNARTSLGAVPWPWIGGAVVIALALALRLALLPTARFSGDEATAFAACQDIVEGKAWPLLGMPITGGAARLPGPAFFYLMALPLVAARAPEAQYAFVEALGALTVGVFWHAMRRPFGEAGALLAGVLMAMSPWSALYADRTANGNVLPFVVVAALLAALRVREDPRSRWLIALLPLCALMPQLHMSAPVAWAGLAVLVAPTVRRWSRRHVVAGLALCVLLYVPLAVHELTTGFGNARAFVAETAAGSSVHALSFLWVPVYALRFLTLDAAYHELAGYWRPDEVAFLEAALWGSTARPFSPWRLGALVASLALAFAAFVVSARSAWLALSPPADPGSRRRPTGPRAAPRRADRPPGARGALLHAAPFGCAFAAALAVNLLLVKIAAKPVHGHYVLNLYPFVFVAYAVLGRALVDVGARARTIVLALALAFCVGGAEATLSISRNVDGRIGLQVHRRTLARIEADGRREGLQAEPVRLEFAYPASLSHWQIFATRALGLTLRLDRAATHRVYGLIERDRPLPPGTFREGPIDVGYALLYRL